MAVRNYFSGCEGGQHFAQAVSAGARHILMSYLYLRKQKTNLLRKRLKEHPRLRFMVDSGAHTLQVSMGKAPYNLWRLHDFEQYLKDYVAWLKKHKDYYHCAVELDIPSCVNICEGRPPDHEAGYAVVERWREKYFAPLAELGIDIIYVWHGGGSGLENWEKMCAKYAYVGLPGELSSQKDFNKFVTVARRYNTKIHGFAASVTGDSKIVYQTKGGLVKQNTIKELFDSCVSFRETSPKEVYGYLPTKLKTWSLTDDLESSFEGIAAVVKHRVRKRVYQIELRGGKSVTGTEDHSFFALTRKGRLIEVKPSELSVGEHLVSSLGLPVSEGRDETVIADYEFFGVWFGDGHVGIREDRKVSSIWCSKQDQPEIQKVCRAFASRYNMSWGLSPNGREGYATNQQLAEIVVKLFGRIGEDKTLDHLLNISTEAQAAFMRGYFSADGSCKGRNKLISLSCYRREHLETIQLVLEGWDIRSGITDAGISGKGSQTWELAISDVESREIFAREIGFIQKDQQTALNAKNSTRAIAGCHRGLPVELLRQPGRVAQRVKGNLRMRPVYPKDRRTAELIENFHPRLLDMSCEYLEIKAITLVSDTWVDVYDLSVPTTERFFANGILAHNTKQADFRDWPWFSVDSITWKTSEIYGTLIVWHEQRQKLIFEQDKAKRARYKQIMQAMGFNARAIIADTDYRELTRFALRSMTAMEEFYVRRYSHRIFYYHLRLPHPKLVSRWKDKRVWRAWQLCTPSKNFQLHDKEKSVQKIRDYLVAISAVQNWHPTYFDQPGEPRDFLKAYFLSFLEPQLSDAPSFKKELALLTAPPAPQAVPRTLDSHYTSENNPPRLREQESLTLEDLLPEPEKLPLSLSEIEILAPV